MVEIILKPKRDKSIKRKHPWIFSGAISEVKGNPELGETVAVISDDGAVLGKAAYSHYSSIRARMWSFDPDQEINNDYFKKRIHSACKLRGELYPQETENNATRLVNAESDSLPGLVVDKYGDYLVAQFLSAGPEKWKDSIVQNLIEITGIKNIYERSDVEVRKLEGLPVKKGVLAGKEPLKHIEILENGKRFFVDIANGQKTGFYLDQRENRLAVQKYCPDQEVLNCFSYTGAFSVYALESDAKHVTSIDASASANKLAQENIRLNGLSEEKNTWITGDVFKELRLFRDKGLQFDVVILDPPKFAPTVSQVRAASRGYKDINMLALKLLRTGGILATFSCSGGIGRQLFQKIVADAAVDANVSVKILEQLSQASDHPIALNFPEGAYLKGLICKVT